MGGGTLKHSGPTALEMLLDTEQADKATREMASYLSHRTPDSIQRWFIHVGSGAYVHRRRQLNLAAEQATRTQATTFTRWQKGPISLGPGLWESNLCLRTRCWRDVLLYLYLVTVQCGYRISPSTQHTAWDGREYFVTNHILARPQVHFIVADLCRMPVTPDNGSRLVRPRRSQESRRPHEQVLAPTYP